MYPPLPEKPIEEQTLRLDRENNEYLRMGMALSLLDKALREHPDVIITLKNGQLRTETEYSIYSTGGYGCYLDTESILNMMRNILAIRVA